jgi:hypothetical protein
MPYDLGQLPGTLLGIYFREYLKGSLPLVVGEVRSAVSFSNSLGSA